MVDTLTLVLAGVVVSTLGMMALRARGLLPESVRVSGPIVTLHTKKGRAFLDWLAAPRRFWRAWGNFGVGIAVVVMFGAAAAVFSSALAAIDQPERTAFSNPQNALVIPGVNDFLPLAAAPEIVFGLVVGLVVHEGGHGLLCRVEDIDIDSMGLAFLSVFPIGAFVEPDEDSRNAASRGSQTRMFAAGVTNNFLVTFLAFLLLFGPVAGSISVAAGLPVGDVLQGSSADDAGLEHGDVVEQVEGTAVANGSEFEAELDRVEGREVSLSLRDGRQLTVERSVLVTRAVPGVLTGIELSRTDPTVVERVNGTVVHTEGQFARAVADRPVVDLTTNRGNTTVPVGAYIARVQSDEPLAAAGAPTDEDRQVVVTGVAGRRVTNASALSTVLDGTEPGETVSVVAYVDGQRQEYQVELTTGDDGHGYLGVRIAPGYSGLVLDDMGIDAYPAEGFLGFLGGSTGPLGGLLSGDFLRNALVVLLLPFFGAFAGGNYNFAGFIPPVDNFYTVTGPLEPLGGGVFLLANVLFWSAWVNLNLGLFNCIPMFPLDGGHILRASTESFIARLPVEEGRRLTSAVTVSVSVAMLVGLAVMLFAPQFL
ncbi:metalloprotease [Halobacteriales archaeon QH_10_67_22]|nr:MAG: metalloprotease [Halobacteriales archaeon QH_10_67_22]